MYECSRCGNRRSKLSPRAADKFDSAREDCIEGASSWCNLCSELTFFMKCSTGGDSVQELFSNSLDSIDSVPSKVSTGLLGGALHSRTDIQNQQAASLANHLSNWAVEAVDPPKTGGSFSVLPNRHGYLIRNRHSEDEAVTPPVTPLNVTSTTSAPSQSGEKTVRKSGPERLSKMAPSSGRSTRHEKDTGIELLRATPPKHLNPGLPLESDRRLSPVNPYAKSYKHRDEQNQKSHTSTKRIKSSDVNSVLPGFTLKDIKKMQRRFAAEESSEAGTSKQARDRRMMASGSQVKSSSNIELQRKLLEKRRQMRKLASIRNRLDVECETAQTELDVLERSNLRSSSRWSKRQSGGAHMTLQHLFNRMQIEKQIREGKKSLQTESSLEAMMNALSEQNKSNIKIKEMDSDQSSLKSYEPSVAPPGTETETDTETVTGGDCMSTVGTSIESAPSSTQTESIVVKKKKGVYVPLADQLRNPFAKPGRVGFYMPSAFRPKDLFQRTQPLGESRRICILLSSAQRALFQRIVNDPLDIVKLIRSLDESTEVTLNAPRAQFSTIACAEKEVIRLTEKKPQVTKMQKAKELDVSRSPVRCPDSDCRRLCFVSDLNNHLLLDHRCLTMERIKARETKTFFLDTNMTMIDRPRCHMVYMVRDKVIDSQAEELHDLLPVLVMSSRTYLTKALSLPGSRAARIISKARRSSDVELFVLWLTGLVPRNMRPLATISLWSTLGPKMAGCVGVNTGYIYDIRAPNDVGQICRSRCSMVLPMRMIAQMTNNARRFLAVQVQVY
ncbi:uncharacterized protein LOC108028812 [Drosophila biarmipes]|uniref:uncharacterized protein LOC108028812 n=1 Tax=Drosophila biarmipes TaxID=125945 RepID=UPI0007E68902|nr:uncharacterized protein LOC108028812 [Drosophila biarmipes]